VWQWRSSIHLHISTDGYAPSPEDPLDLPPSLFQNFLFKVIWVLHSQARLFASGKEVMVF
jgi:hypothetical protein